MNCLICRQAELVDGLTSIQFERGEMHSVIHHVPAQVCPGCGEAYVDQVVAETLLLQANSIFESGILESETEYNVPV